MTGIFKPLFGTPLNREHPLSNGLVGCWIFNEGSGTIANDSSGLGNHGTLVNMANPPLATSGWGPGPHGGALGFNGSGSKIELGTIQQAKAPCTIIAWIKPSSIDDVAILGVSGINNGGLEFRLFNSRLQLLKNYVALIGASAGLVLIDIWVNVAVTYSSSGAYCFYINGLLSGSGSSLQTMTYFNMAIGSCRNAELFRGIINDLSIYDRVLSAEEIAYLYAFPYCMFDEPVYPAWMIPGMTPGISAGHYYRHLLAGGMM